MRQLASRFGGYAGLKFVGAPKRIADEMEQWLVEEGSDGFNVMFPLLPAGLDDFVDHVVPELQRRGIFRRGYEGTTLRENLGFPRPENRFFPARSTAGHAASTAREPKAPFVNSSFLVTYHMHDPTRSMCRSASMAISTLRR